MDADRHTRALEKARALIVDQFLDEHAHTVYIGYEHQAGERTGRRAVVVEVAEKFSGGSADVEEHGHYPLPPFVEVQGVRVPVDVVQAPLHRDLRLRMEDARDFVNYYYAPHSAGHQRCHNRVVGGLQIAPAGKTWVGTLGAACWSVRHRQYGFLTNYHVAESPVGTLMRQPSQANGPVGALRELHPIRFDGGDNLVDAAFVNATTRDGVVMARPELYGLGNLHADPRTAVLGDRVQKSGRTTGVTRGEIAGVGATSIVNFGGGRRARFTRQIVIRGAATFSAPGDSGSLIVDELRRPVGLLFAGGGGSTLANPIGLVLQALDLEFYFAE